MDLVSTYPFAYGERVYCQGMECVVQSISTSGTVCLGNYLQSDSNAHADISELDTTGTEQVTPRCLFYPKLDRMPVAGDFVTIKSEFVPLARLVSTDAGRVGVVSAVSHDGFYITFSPGFRVMFRDVSRVEVLDLPRAVSLPRVRIPEEALPHFSCRPVIIVDTENDSERIAIIDISGCAFFHEENDFHLFIMGHYQVFTILYPTSTVKPDFGVL